MESNIAVILVTITGISMIFKGPINIEWVVEFYDQSQNKNKNLKFGIQGKLSMNYNILIYF